MIKVLIAMLCILTAPFAYGEVNLLAEGEYDGYVEEEIVAKVPYRSFFSTKEVEISGTLRYPRLKEGVPARKFPVIVYNHGSQDRYKPGNARTSSEIVVSLLVRKGFALFTPVRKGFANNGIRKNDLDADRTEPITCQWGEWEQGVSSAKEDLKALLTSLSKNENVDMTKLIMSGHSRGGYLSIAYVVDNPSSSVGVIGFVPIWHSETCHSGATYNKPKFGEFAKTIRFPVYAFYANNDLHYSMYHVDDFVRILSVNKEIKIEVHPGDHFTPRGDIDLWNKAIEGIFKSKGFATSPTQQK